MSALKIRKSTRLCNFIIVLCASWYRHNFSINYKFFESSHQGNKIWDFFNCKIAMHSLTHIILRGTVVPQPFKTVYQGQISHKNLFLMSYLKSKNDSLYFDIKHLTFKWLFSPKKLSFKQKSMPREMSRMKMTRYRFGKTVISPKLLGIF